MHGEGEKIYKKKNESLMYAIENYGNKYISL